MPSRQGDNHLDPSHTNNNNKNNKTLAGRYYAHINSDHPIALPRTLPHDTVFMAQVHPAHVHAFTQHSTLLFIARFSKGLMLVSEKDWKMVSRLSIEGAGLVCCVRSSNIINDDDDNNKNTTSGQSGEDNNKLSTNDNICAV